MPDQRYRYMDFLDTYAALSRETVRVGVDIGQSVDPTAIVVTRKMTAPDMPATYQTHSLERLPLQMSFVAQADRIAEVVAGLKTMSTERTAKGQQGYSVELVVDATGIGRVLIDLLRERRLAPIAVTIVAGDKSVERIDKGISIGKYKLIGDLKLLMEQRRMRLPETEEAYICAKELQNYHEKQNDQTGYIRYDARSGSHDDLLFALGLSVIDRSTGGGSVLAFRIVSGQW